MSQVCRTCLKQVTPSDSVGLNDPIEDSSSSSVGVKQELAICVPELDLDLVANAVVCTACVSDLHATYRFKRKCLQTEEKIQFCVQSAAMDISQVELKNLMNLINCSKSMGLEAVEDPLSVENIKHESGFPANDEDASEQCMKLEPPFENWEHNCDVADIVDDSVSKTCEDADGNSSELFKCDICNQNFNTNQSFDAHKESHAAEKTYKCTLCDYTTLHNKNLIQHVQTHTKDIPVIVHNTTNKRKTFTIEDKVDIIRKLEGGKKISEVCRETGLATSTVCCIWKSKDTILRAFEKNGPHIKRLRKPLHADVDEALFIWFKEQGADIPITGPLLKSKAIELARAMGNYDFVCSGSWLDRFKARYNICFAKKRC